MAISFAWTTPALLAGEKTVTRRSWKPDHAARFEAGQMVDAWDRNPRAGGIRVGTIRLTRTPYVRSTGSLTWADYQLEGITWLEATGVRPPRPATSWPQWWRDWKAARERVYVVEFEVVSMASPDEYAAERALATGAWRRVKGAA